MPASVHENEFPKASALDQQFIDRASYKDSFSVELLNREASPVELFQAVFGNRPTWMKAVMIARNWVAAIAGIEAPSVGEIMNPIFKSKYEVGGKIGAWPIYTLTHNELIAGRDNSHLDFRISILRQQNSDRTTVFISTACAVNNAFGRIYLWLILPLHRRGLRFLIASASNAGRL